MEELRKQDREFARFYAQQKGKWKKEQIRLQEADKQKYEKQKIEFKEQIMQQYIKSLEERQRPKQISFGKVSQCYRVSPNIIKKVFLVVNHNRISWELDALKKLEAYEHFPRVLCTDTAKGTFYMNDVGRSLKEIKSKSQMPRDLFVQVDYIIDALKKTNIFHRDLALEHFRIRNGVLSLIDFEKIFLTREQYEQNKKNNSAMWQKLTYHDMNHIKVMIQKYYDSLH
jgi:hypothetical protein